MGASEFDEEDASDDEDEPHPEGDGAGDFSGDGADEGDQGEDGHGRNNAPAATSPLVWPGRRGCCSTTAGSRTVNIGCRSSRSVRPVSR